MVNILLVCYAGMSTSILMRRMQKAAEDHNVELSIQAVPLTNDLETQMEGVQLVLTGPQMKHAIPDIKKYLNGRNIIVQSIDAQAYGMMDGEKVLYQAIKTIRSNQ